LRPESPERFLSWIDSLQFFAEEIRGNWDNPQQHQHVLQRLDEARAIYRALMERPPAQVSGSERGEDLR
jgi:hypothetical protein